MNQHTKPRPTLENSLQGSNVNIMQQPPFQMLISVSDAEIKSAQYSSSP